jgi:hypothetical protein
LQGADQHREGVAMPIGQGCYDNVRGDARSRNRAEFLGRASEF